MVTTEICEYCVDFNMLYLYYLLFIYGLWPEN